MALDDLEHNKSRPVEIGKCFKCLSVSPQVFTALSTTAVACITLYNFLLPYFS